MYSLQDPNIFNIAVKGVFDDCQDIVKAVSNDLEFKARYQIGAVNSINWARVVAQVVYYFKGYFAATRATTSRCRLRCRRATSATSSPANARMMGLPIRPSDPGIERERRARRVFPLGPVPRPRGRGDVCRPLSPSMDISRASNFERFMYDLVWA